MESRAGEGSHLLLGIPSGVLLLGTFPKAGKVWEGRPGEDSVEGAMARAGPRPVATLKRSAGVGG